MFQNIDKKNSIEIIFLIFGSGMVFYELLSPIFVSIISIIIYLFGLINLSSKYNMLETLVLLSVLAIPTSMISIFGVNYSTIPLNWFTIFILCAMFLIILHGKINKIYFISITVFSITEFVISLMSHSFTNAMKQYLMIVLFLFVFYIGDNLKKSITLTFFYDLFKFYLIGTFCFANQVFLQRTYISLTGNIIGHYIVMGQSRVAYGGILGDYSFATLYLSTGCLLILLIYIHHKKINLSMFIFSEILLLIAMLIVSSRTGIISLVITILLYIISNIKKIPKRFIFVIFFSSFGFPLLINKLLSSRGGQALLETSGRSDNYVQSLNFWLKKPIFGYGLGLENLFHATELAVPHNFFMQYLLQMGIVGLVLIMIPFIIFINNDIYCKKNEFKWSFILIFIGSMFIPDIVSSRFLHGIILLCMTGNKVYNDKRLEVSNGET
ncbi:O-antigen ligase family protein [Streptococcus parasuis]